MLRAAAASIALAMTGLASTEVVANEAATAAVLEDGGFFELGIAMAIGSSNREQLDEDDNDKVVAEISPILSGAWRKGRWFIEGVHGSFDGGSIGATVWHDDRWVVDLLVLNAAGDFTVDVGGQGGEGDSTRADEKLLERTTGFAAGGVRARRFLGSTLMQASAIVDYEHANGMLFAAHVGKQWQLGNWNTQLLVGARHATTNLADHVWGIDDDEATARFPAHEVSGITFGEAQLSASRALGRDWVFNALLRGRQFDAKVTDSPLVTSPGFVRAETSISYFF